MLQIWEAEALADERNLSELIMTKFPLKFQEEKTKIKYVIVVLLFSNSEQQKNQCISCLAVKILFSDNTMFSKES